MKRVLSGVLLLSAVCALAFVPRLAYGAALSEAEMRLVHGGANQKGLCGYLGSDCANTMEDPLKEVGEDCWLCLKGRSQQVNCKRAAGPNSLCKAHSIATWCGSRYESMVFMDPHTGEKSCPPPSPLPIAGEGCPGTGDPVNWCPPD